MTDKKWDVIDVELAAEAMMVAVDTACTAALSFASSIAFEGDEEQAGEDLKMAKASVNNAFHVCRQLSALGSTCSIYTVTKMAEAALLKAIDARRKVDIFLRVKDGRLPWKWIDDTVEMEETPREALVRRMKAAGWAPDDYEPAIFVRGEHSIEVTEDESHMNYEEKIGRACDEFERIEMMDA